VSIPIRADAPQNQWNTVLASELLIDARIPDADVIIYACAALCATCIALAIAAGGDVPVLAAIGGYEGYYRTAPAVSGRSPPVIRSTNTGIR
jgi:hypothetical protein